MNNTEHDNNEEMLVEKINADEQLEYGITTTQITYYHYGDYRYTSLKYAIAAAKRDKKIGVLT